MIFAAAQKLTGIINRLVIVRPLNQAFQLHQNGQLEEAAELYARLLRKNPNSFDALHLLGVLKVQQRKLKEGSDLISQALKINPRVAPAHTNLGNALQELKRYDDAIASYQRALELNPDYAEAHNNLGNALQALKRYDDAIASYQRALELNPNYAKAHNNLGNALGELKRYDDAIASYQRALALKPDFAEVYYNLGVALQGLERYDDAIASYQRALALKPGYAEVHNNLGKVLQAMERYDDAIASYQRALALNPDYAEARTNLGNALQALKRYDDAIASYRRALELNPDYAEAHTNLGNALQALKRYDDAIASYQRALALKPDFAEVYYNLGVALQGLERFDDAIASYQRALALKLDYADLHNNLGSALQALKRYDDAIVCYRRVLELKPDDAEALSEYVLLRRRICNWHDLAAIEQGLIAASQSEQHTTHPFMLLTVIDDPAVQLTAARNYCANKAYTRFPVVWTGQPYAHDKLRLAYLSADFREHATAHLMAELFERHDRSRFEVTAFSCGPDDGSPMRRRLVQAFAQFLDVRPLSDLAVAHQIRALEIDILVDLKGFTQGSRLSILAHRPAPIQVNYLGYPATLGADFIDYIIVDPFIAPLDQQPFFTEKLVHLPECYQVNDSQRAIAARTPTRAECGLPEQGFVFCCFNNTYKLTPLYFDIWMRLRNWPDQTPVRVFVLRDDNPTHSLFSKQILNIYPHQLRLAWDRLVFSGTGQAPTEVSSEAEMRERVAKTPGAIGYLPRSMINGSVRILPVQ